MRALIFNHHPDCLLYIWKAMTDLGIDVEVATESLTTRTGFSASSTKNNKFEVVNKLYAPEEFHSVLKNVKFSDTANHDLYVSIQPEINRFFGEKALFDARMQAYVRNLGSLPCKKSCNHPDAESFGFKFCSNWVPQSDKKLDSPKLITQLITQHHLVPETQELLDIRRTGFKDIRIYGGDNCPDGFIRDVDILPHTSLLIHNKNFGINCYAVCKALDLGIPVYISKSTKKLIGFGDLPDELFYFKDDYSIMEAYQKSLSCGRKYIQDTFRSIYTLERTKETLLEILK